METTVGQVTMGQVTVGQVTVGLRELKARLSELVHQAERGEDILVTDHGRPVARITAPSPGLADVLARPRVGNGGIASADVVESVREGRSARS